MKAIGMKVQDATNWEKDTVVVFQAVIDDQHEVKHLISAENMILTQMKMYSCLTALEVVMAFSNSSYDYTNHMVVLQWEYDCFLWSVGN